MSDNRGTMHTKVRAALLATCIASFLSGPVPRAWGQGTEVQILCSNGIRAAVEKLLPGWERSLKTHIKIQYGASANFKRSIEGGEGFDLAILTPPLVEDLIKQGKIAAGSETEIASTGVGFAVRAGVPKPDVTTPDAIKQLLLKAKSIGYVKQGASTTAIVNLFDRLGISNEIPNKIIYQPGAAESMASVASGQVEVGIALISEVLSVPGVQLAGPFPADYQARITMAAGISASSTNHEVAGKIVKALTGADAARTIKATGLEPVKAGK